MKYVKDKVERINQKPGIEGMYEIMELAARTCYKTEDCIKEGSAHKIIDNIIIPSGHTSVLEFGTVYLKCSIFNCIFYFKYLFDRYSRVRFHMGSVYITTTYRTILQGNYKDPVEAIEHNFDLNWKSDLEKWCEPTEYHHKRYCIRFNMDRVGSQSVMRHRGVWGISYAQESTRYVNYNRDKFGHDISISLPSKFYELIDRYDVTTLATNTKEQGYDGILTVSMGLVDWELEDQIEYLRKNSPEWNVYEDGIIHAEEDYMKLVGEYGWKPQDARGILNLDINTEFMMCAYMEDWNMWLFRRLDKHAHPHIQNIAKIVKKELK